MGSDPIQSEALVRVLVQHPRNQVSALRADMGRKDTVLARDDVHQSGRHVIWVLHVLKRVLASHTQIQAASTKRIPRRFCTQANP